MDESLKKIKENFQILQSSIAQLSDANMTTEEKFYSDLMHETEEVFNISPISKSRYIP